MNHFTRILVVLAVLVGGFSLVTRFVAAKDHTLMLRVKDPGGHPFEGVLIGLDGVGGSPQRTDVNGFEELTLGMSTKPSDLVSLLITPSPPHLDLVMIDPYEHPVRVPGFDDNTNNYVPITVATLADKKILQSGSGMLAIYGALTRAAAKRHRKNINSSVIGIPQVTRSSWPLRPPQQEPPVARSKNESPSLTQEDLLEVSRLFQLPVENIVSALEFWDNYSLGWRLLSAKSATYGIVAPFSRVAGTNDIQFGVGEWSFRSCSLQRVLLKFSSASPNAFSTSIGENTKEFLNLLHEPCSTSAVQLSRLISDSDNRITPDWRARFQALGAEPAFQRVEFEEAADSFKAAVTCATNAGLKSELAVTFCFDLNRWLVDGRVLAAADQEALADNSAFAKEEKRPPDELERLFIFVNRVGDPHNFPQGSGRVVAQLSRVMGYAVANGQTWYPPQSVPLEDLGLEMRDFESGGQIAVHRDESLLKQFRAGWFPSEPDRMAWHP